MGLFNRIKPEPKTVEGIVKSGEATFWNADFYGPTGRLDVIVQQDDGTLKGIHYTGNSNYIRALQKAVRLGDQIKVSETYRRKGLDGEDQYDYSIPVIVKSQNAA